MKARSLVLGGLALALLWAAPAVLGAPAADAHGGHAPPGLFTGDWGNIVLTLAIFLIFFAILSKAAWKPLVSALQERERTIRESIEAAAREREAAQKLLADYQAQLQQARSEASAIVEEGRRDAQVVRQRIQEEARREADELIARARREIQLATDEAGKELYDRATDLALQVAAAVAQKSLRPEDHRELIRQSLDQVRATAASGNGR